MKKILEIVTISTLAWFSFLNIIYQVHSNTQVLRPRGVPLSKKSFYDPSKDFQCLDGLTTIPFLLVNDDYCDCDDGSDEPGTSACPNGVFHCSNIGFLEKVIPSSRINDGICDCCDGSDEYNSTNKCMSNCFELGEQMRLERERYLELLKQGNEIRQKYIEIAKEKIEETRKELENLHSNFDEAEKIKNETLELRNHAETLEKEALEKHREKEDKIKKQQEEEEQKKRETIDKDFASSVFKKIDHDGNNKINYRELQKIQLFDRDNDGVVSDDEAKFFLNAADELVFDDFFESAWPLLKPLYENQQTTNEKELEANPDSESASLDFPNENTNYETNDEEPLSNEDVEENAEKYNAKQPEQAPSVTLEYDESTAQLVEEAKKARDQFNEAEGKFLEIQTKIRELQVLLETDYGPNREYMALNGQCFELHDNEYIYKLCPFDSASQRSKNGGSETSLGRWGKWIGSDNNRYEKFILEGGSQCWNGPTRSVIVYVNCGSDNLLSRATEPNRCEYAFDFKTPAACILSSASVPENDSDSNHLHTEL